MQMLMVVKYSKALSIQWQQNEKKKEAKDDGAEKKKE